MYKDVIQSDCFLKVALSKSLWMLHSSTPMGKALNNTFRVINFVTKTFLSLLLRDEAKELLENKENGSFLIRESVVRAGEYALALK